MQKFVLWSYLSYFGIRRLLKVSLQLSIFSASNFTPLSRMKILLKSNTYQTTYCCSANVWLRESSPLPVMTCLSSRLTHRVVRMEGQVITGTYQAPVASPLPVKEIQTLLTILGPYWTDMSGYPHILLAIEANPFNVGKYNWVQYNHHTNLFLLDRHQTVIGRYDLDTKI